MLKSVAQPRHLERGERGIGKSRQILRKVFDPARIAGLLTAFLVWQVASHFNPQQVPGPVAVFENAFANLFFSTRLTGIGLPSGGYFPHLLFTAKTVILGGMLGALIGTLTGLCSAESRWFNDLAEPIVSLLGTIPIVVAAPFFLMWFGLSEAPQLALVVFYSATVLHVFAARAAFNQPPQFLEYAETLGASRLRRFFTVRVPGALPQLFGGLRIALSSAWGLAAVTEMLAGQSGTGRVLTALKATYDVEGILSMVILLGVLAVLVDLIVVLLQAHITRWLPRRQGN